MRSKWFKPRDNVEVGDVVLMMDDDCKRSQWSMGRVVDTYPDNEGRVRSVEVKTTKVVYKRPITRLCLLLSKKEYEMCEKC